MCPPVTKSALAITQTPRKSCFFHVYSVWLFTRSDLKTIVVPQSAFGILNALALSQQPNWKNALDRTQLLARIPTVLFWVWINLLPFAIDNQRQAAAILEDKHNKPWRTMPAGRMTPAQAKTLMFCLYPVAFCASLWLGGIRQCLALMLLGYSYNDLNLADWSWVSRNAINALGFCCFASGSLEVALDMPLQAVSSEHRPMLAWLGVIAAVVFSTVQTQDMADQEGDRMRARKSLPLTVGDGTSRRLTAVLVAAWSVFCPLYWGVGRLACLFLGCLGLVIACSMLMFRSVEADKRTFRMWNGWMASLYMLPLVAAIGM